jgi:hypothetical protein
MSLVGQTVADVFRVTLERHCSVQFKLCEMLAEAVRNAQPEPKRPRAPQETRAEAHDKIKSVRASVTRKRSLDNASDLSTLPWPKRDSKGDRG